MTSCPRVQALSRFLAALTEAPVEALRTLFLDDLLVRPITLDKQTGEPAGPSPEPPGSCSTSMERERQRGSVCCPRPMSFLQPFAGWMTCAPPFYRGRKRGEVVRTRTTVSQAHSYHWLGSFGNKGNGHSREELRKGLAAITRYLTAYQLEPSHTLLQLDGQYGTGAALSEVAGFAFVTRGKDYSVLDHPLVQARLHLPLINSSSGLQSQMVRSLYDCPQVPVGPAGVLCRVVVATHPATKKKSPVGVTRAGVVYELFFTNLPQRAFTACDVVELYLHRSAFEPLLSDLRPGDRSRPVV